MPKNFATRDGDEIVIRVSIQTLHEMMAEAALTSMLEHPVTIRRENEFVNALLDGLNKSNAIEAMLTCEVGEMVERRSRVVEEHRPLMSRRRAA